MRERPIRLWLQCPAVTRQSQPMNQRAGQEGLGHLGLAGGSFPGEIRNPNRGAGPGHKYRTAPPNALAQECPGQRLHGSSQTS